MKWRTARIAATVMSGLACIRISWSAARYVVLYPYYCGRTSTDK